MMRTMRVGEDLIFLNHVTDINCAATDDETGVVLTVTTANTEKEYLIPDEMSPELVISVIQTKIEQQHHFNLLRTLGRMHDND